MKKIILTFTMLLFAVFGLYAQSYNNVIKGTLTNTTNNTPMQNQAVYIVADSTLNPTFNYYKVVYTNANGFYSDTIYAVPTQVVYNVMTSDCKGGMVTNTEYGGNNIYIITSNFSIQCGGGSGCNASYYAYRDSTNLLTYYFANTSTAPNGSTYSWDFGDNTTSTQVNPHHTYANYGYYYVCLNILDNLQNILCSYCDTLIVDSINANKCQAYFNYTENNGTVNFNGYATPSDTSTTYTWSFGDGTSSTLQNPTHQYNSPNGTYSVCLTIVTNGCTDQYCQTITIGNTLGCQAYFYSFPDSSNTQTPPFNYQFFDQSTGTTNTTSYSWTFGDGGTSNSINPHHAYNHIGYYTVCLTITDTANNCSSTYCDSIRVDTANNQGCQAYFQFNVSGNWAHFYGSASPNNPNTLYSWDFGDTSFATIQNPTHQYAGPGTYYVCLTITQANCTSTYCNNVIIGGSNNNAYVCGQVWADSALADIAKVYMIGVDTINNTYSYIYNTNLDTSGQYCFHNVASGLYIILATLSQNSIYYNNYLPTYYGDVDNWQNATMVYVAPSATLYGKDIHLVGAKGAGSGNGNLGGNVIEGQKKLFGQGDPISGVEILLLDEYDEALAVTFSDASGNFLFDNIAFGKYKIYGELAGLKCMPATIVLDASNPDVLNVNVKVSESGINASVSDQLSEMVSRIGNIYPNPITENASLEISMLKSARLSMNIYDVLGQKVSSATINAGVGSTLLPVNVNNLNEGIYTLELTSPEGIKIIRRFTKVN